MKKKNIRSQAFIEYAVLICVVAAALMAMRLLFGRSINAKYRQSADVFGEGEQYASGVTKVTDLDDAGTPPLDPPDPPAPRSCNGIRIDLETLTSDLKTYCDNKSAFEDAPEAETLQEAIDYWRGKESEQRGIKEGLYNELYGEGGTPSSPVAPSLYSQLADYQAQYDACLSTIPAEGEEPPDCSSYPTLMTNLQNNFITPKVNAMNTAAGLEAKYKKYADDLQSGATSLADFNEDIGAEEGKVDQQITDKQAEIDQLLSDYAKCSLVAPYTCSDDVCSCLK